MPWKQEKRLLAVDTPLGKDVLLLTAFKGREGVSRLFEFDLTMLSENHSLSFEAAIGNKATASITLADGSQRHINGIVSRFSQGRGGGEKGGDPRFSFYRATLVPWTWLLTRTADSRIFQNISVPDIIRKIFTEKGFQDHSFRLQKSYDPKEYCVQYRETDFDFISRLMEEEGIYYFFEHQEGSHTMVLADAPSEHKPCPNQATARYSIVAEGLLEEDVITGFETMKQIRAGKYTLNDYDFTKPNTGLEVPLPSKQPLGPGEREVYDHPGRYTVRSDGERLTNIRMEEEEARITIVNGSSICRAFTSGYRFTLSDHYRPDMNKDYVLAEIDHEARYVEEYPGASVLEKEPEFTYENRFACIPYEIPFRPLRITPRPVVKGSQTAIVVGPAGEEIYTDEHGRVKVQFHWDREGKRDDNSSCWIRVSQLWAGASWGAMWIPRIGHEVIVDFLEGDPDMPIITGRVYHGMNRPPYALPAEKTKSTIKSDSSLGGGGFNEFRFEDKKGEEEIFLHGQKDWNINILNDKNQAIHHNEKLHVGNNRDKLVSVDQSETIGNNKTITVVANHTEIIGGNKSLTVGMNHTEVIGMSMLLTVTLNKVEVVGVNSLEVVGAAKETVIGGVSVVTIGSVSSETVGSDKHETVGSEKNVNVGADLTESIGGGMSVSVDKSYALDVSKKVTISAGDEIVLTTGSASITMKKSGAITIKGSKIDVKATGKVTVKGSKILEN